MKQIYPKMQIQPKKSSEFRKQPKRETIEFLINFSKSLEVIKTKQDFVIELNLN
jgi:hypothetical protein